MSYCDYCLKEDTHEVHKYYHDNEYGFPLENDDELFGRLILEINQAGLSWETILKKKDSFKHAYSGFSIERVARYDEKDIERLLNDSGIIRNRLKINAAIYNAEQLLLIRSEFGTFKEWLDKNHPRSKQEWVKLFRRNFKFVGGEIVNEFLMSTGYLSGAHDEGCPVYERIKEKKPRWLEDRF